MEHLLHRLYGVDAPADLVQYTGSRSMKAVGIAVSSFLY